MWRETIQRNKRIRIIAILIVGGLALLFLAVKSALGSSRSAVETAAQPRGLQLP
jgi:hypothetical protein